MPAAAITPTRTKRRRFGVVAATSALALVSTLVLGGPAPTAGADEPYLPQDVGLFYDYVGCDLHLGALAEIKIGAEVHVIITGNAPVAYRETFVVDNNGSGIFDETLLIGDDYMPAAGGGAHIGMALTYQGVLIDDYVAPLLADVGCADLVPLDVTVDATGAVPAGASLEVAVRTGECGNDQTPAAVISPATLPATVTVWADLGAACPSPVDALGATMTYLPDQQTQVEEVVGASVTVVFGFADAPVDPIVPDGPADPVPTTTTTTVVQDPPPVTVDVLAVGLAAAATPVVVSPSFTG
jgi:hypothetical protein